LLRGPRPTQEDFVLSDVERGFFVLADGFGSQAAKLACESVREFLVKEAGDEDATLPFVLRSYFSLAGNVLFNSLIHANRKLMKANQGKTIHERSGSSAIAGFLDGDLLALANVGCCSAVLIREGRYQQLVTPRSYRRLCNPFESEAGDPSVPDAPLTALGVGEDLEPEIFEFRVRAGDRLVLFSDGASGAWIEQGVELLEGPLSEVKPWLESLAINDNFSLSLLVFKS
jgi:serine/threonine protein phosphatase PrpC